MARKNLSSNYKICWESHQGAMGSYLGLSYSSLESCNSLFPVFYNQLLNDKYKIFKSDTLYDHLWCSIRHLKAQYYNNLDIQEGVYGI